MVYVTPSVTRLFLSRETCSDLGLIFPQFPSTPTAAAASSIPLPGQSRLGSPHSTHSPPSGNGKASGPSREQRTLQTNTAPPPPPAEKRTCGCPTRSLPPTGPISLLRRRTGVHWSSTCGRHSKPPRSMSVHTNPFYDGRTAPASQGGLSARSLGEHSQRAPRPRCSSRGTGKSPGRHT